jgi:hypothetical protein
MIAAMMTAANLGARVTGWGFVVFTVGSLCWTAIGFSSGQTNLLASNGFLTLVNLIGIWRWLGRQRAYQDGGKSAEAKSRASSAPTLFTATGVTGMAVEDERGAPIGKAVEALIECNSGCISYVVVSTSKAVGLDEDLRPVPREAIRFGCERLVLTIDRRAYDAIVPLPPGEWPDASPVTPERTSA